MLLPTVFTLLLLQDPASDLIKNLGDPDINVRASAFDALRKGLPALAPDLERHRNDPDLEVALRCRQLLAAHHRAVAAAKDLAERRIRGAVALSDPKRNRLAIDCRQRDNARAGDRFQVTREGLKLGVIVITEVQTWGSWAAPEEGTSLEAIQKGDRLERLVDPPASK